MSKDGEKCVSRWESACLVHLLSTDPICTKSRTFKTHQHAHMARVKTSDHLIYTLSQRQINENWWQREIRTRWSTKYQNLKDEMNVNDEEKPLLAVCVRNFTARSCSQFITDGDLLTDWVNSTISHKLSSSDNAMACVNQLCASPPSIDRVQW
jgi:hypothetical protein